MADVITRFKLETTQYDSKLRDAAKGLKDFTHQAELGGKNFTNFSQRAIESASSLGTIASGATNAKDKVKDLVGAYNEAAKAYNSLSQVQQQSDFGKNLASSISQLKDRLTEAKKELYGLGNAIEDVKSKSSGLFGEGGLTGMMAVAGGNLLSKGVTMLASELTGAISQSIELARQGEGVRIAFERLNQPGLLDKLKEATHGTVSEVELMKQAIKFENFKLPLEDLATYLAFAQQKAKDTGESVDYMVNSITTGLGRQSKQILDNLGISAAELTKRMGEGATMTEAVAAIIREEMGKAGGYIETAADRASQAAAKAADEMEAFGRTAAPIAEEWSQTWNALSVGAMSFANILLGPVARSIRSIQNILYEGQNGETYKDRIIEQAFNSLKGSDDGKWNGTRGYTSDYQKKTAPGGYVEVKDASGKVIRAGHFDNEDQRQKIINPSKITTGRSSGRSSQPSYMEGSISEQQALVSALNKKWQDAAGTVKNDYLTQLVAAESVLAKMKESDALDKWDAGYQMRKGGINIDMSSITGADNTALSSWYSQAKDQQFMGLTKDGQKALSNQQKQDGKQQKKKGEDKSFVDVADQMVGGINNMVGSLEQMGIELPEGFKGVINGISGVIGVLNSIVMIVNAIQAMQEVGTFLGIFANGGIVPKFADGGLIGKAALGIAIPGNSMSGDNLRLPVDGGRGFIGVNSGEVILNRAQMGVLASALEGSGAQGMQLSATIRGEDIRLSINNNGRRTGRGEFVQSTRRR